MNTVIETSAASRELVRTEAYQIACHQVGQNEEQVQILLCAVARREYLHALPMNGGPEWTFPTQQAHIFGNRARIAEINDLNMALIPVDAIAKALFAQNA